MYLEINQIDTIAYGTHGHKMLICYPKNALDASGNLLNSYPALVLLHHGGWGSGSRLDLVQHAREIAKQGVVVACPDYTLASAETEPALPAVMAEIGEAIATVASWKCVVGKPITLGGLSAGGHLAIVYAATQPNTLHAVLAVGAPVDLVQWEAYLEQENNPTFDYLLGSGYTEATLHAASPMHMSLSGLTVPVYMIQGGADLFGDLTDMTPFYERLIGAGATVQMWTCADGDHLLSNAIPSFAGCCYPHLR